MKNRKNDIEHTNDAAEIALASAIVFLFVVAFIGLFLAIAIWGDPGAAHLPWIAR